MLKILVFAKKVNCAVRAYLDKYLARAVHLSTTFLHSHSGEMNGVHFLSFSNIFNIVFKLQKDLRPPIIEIVRSYPLYLGDGLFPPPLERDVVVCSQRDYSV